MCKIFLAAFSLMVFAPLDGGAAMLLGYASIQGGTNRGILRSHCLRLYSRALTAAEIATNNAIDKARFNLS